jgi:hypothetical protein
MGDAPMFLPQGYKTATKSFTEVNDKTTIITREHFNGSVDQTVKLKALRLDVQLDGGVRREHLAAIAELEAANKEHLLAKHSGSVEWAAYTTRRLKAANVRLVEVEG